MVKTTSAGDSVTHFVTDLYRKYPYPPLGEAGVAEILELQPGAFARLHLGFTLRRRTPFPRGMKIWVAGCGAIQAVQVAKLYPDAQVLGTDLSDVSLRISQQFAARLGADNLEFRRENILESGYRDEFDFIVCTGVLHALEDPVAGLRGLRAALKPEGAALIMVYNANVRRRVLALQRCVDLLVGQKRDVAVRFAAATSLVQAALTAPRTAGLKEYLARHRLTHKDRVIEFADRIVHPREVAYDLDQFYEYIEAGGCRAVGWQYPGSWELSRYLTEPKLVALARDLMPRDRERLAYLLSDEQSPMFDMFVERDDCAARSELSVDEILQIKPLALNQVIAHRIRGRQVVATRSRSPVVRRQGAYVRSMGRKDISTITRLSPMLWRTVQMSDGARTCAELAERHWGRSFDAENTAAIFAELMGPDVALLAPSSS